MKITRYRMTVTAIAAAFALTFASGCGADVSDAPSEIGVNQDSPSPSESRPHGSPDSIDRQSNTPPYAPDATMPGNPSVDSPPCVFSADAAERLNRPVCQS